MTPLLPPDADAFFAVDRVQTSGSCELRAGFAVMVVVDGNGVVQAEIDGERQELRRGDAVVVPHGAGPHRLCGTISVLRFTPAAPRAS
jgi:mannose-6-phosphate isomerase